MYVQANHFSPVAFLYYCMALWLIRESAFFFHQCPDSALAPQVHSLSIYFWRAFSFQVKNHSFSGKTFEVVSHSFRPHPITCLHTWHSRTIQLLEFEQFRRALLQSNRPCGHQVCVVSFPDFPLEYSYKHILIRSFERDSRHFLLLLWVVVWYYRQGEMRDKRWTAQFFLFFSGETFRERVCCSCRL